MGNPEDFGDKLMRWLDRFWACLLLAVVFTAIITPFAGLVGLIGAPFIFALSWVCMASAADAIERMM